VSTELLEKSPLTGVSRGSFRNPAKDMNVPYEWYQRLVNVCSIEWQVIITLVHIGGLRCPSEVLALEWNDVRTDTNQIVVRCKKTGLAAQRCG
jgi:integrase